MKISHVILKGDNFQEWEKSIRNAFRARRKLAFIDGTLECPAADNTDYEDWCGVNSMMVGWTLQSIDPGLRSSLPYSDSVKTLWDHIKQRFSIGNIPRIYQLKAELSRCQQNGEPIAAYYGRLRLIQEELETYANSSSCSCGKCACDWPSKVQSIREEDAVLQFLMGLDDNMYGTLRSNILAQDPLPNLSRAYSLAVQEESRATIEWKNLPTDILSIIDKLLGTDDMDNLRLRSVCSTWRSSLPLPHKPITFPLKLPLLPGAKANVVGDFFLNEIILYRVSPTTDIADDDGSSNGWLLKVSSQTNSKVFTVLNPPHWMEAPIPKDLNLLDYRISEISKSYSVNFTGDDVFMAIGAYRIVLPLWNYFTDCEFAVLALRYGGTLLYWKLGDDDWTPIDDTVDIDYVALHQGKCYAVYDQVLACLDSDMKLNVVAAWPQADYPDLAETYLVECNSDLFVVFYSVYEDFFDQPDFDEPDFFDEPVARVHYGLRKFNECNSSLDSVEDLTDVFIILNDFASQGASHAFTANDFAGFEGESVYIHNYKANYGGMGVFYTREGIGSP